MFNQKKVKMILVMGIMLFSGAIFPSMVSAQSDIRVAVMPKFTNITGSQELNKWREGISERLITSLSKIPDIRVIERTQIIKVVEELGLSQKIEGIIDSTTAVKIGKGVAANYIVIGSFVEDKGDIQINTRLINVETTEVKTAQETVWKKEDSLEQKMQKIDQSANQLIADILPPLDRTDILYTFNTSIEGWNGYEVSLTRVGNPSVDGIGSLQFNARITGKGWSDNTIESPEISKDMSNYQEFTMQVFIPSTAPSGLKAQMFCKSGTEWKWTDSGWRPLTPGTWTMFSISASDIADISYVRTLGVKVGANKVYTGTVNCDKVEAVKQVPSESAKTTPHVTIAYPTNGREVGREIIVRGTALIPTDNHLWVLARRYDFAPLWWPQREAKVDPQTHQWSATVVFGGPQDIAWEFDIGVITVNEDEHKNLMGYWLTAMQTGDWRAIRIPETTLPPQILKVKKVSH